MMFRVSNPGDSEQIAALVNAAYRPKSATEGWTHESGLVSGQRISANQVAALAGDGSVVLVAESGEEIVGCVHIGVHGLSAHIGMLAVAPVMQNTGLGKALLDFAEKYAKNNFAVQEFRMVVVSQREELLAFYGRRGYRHTGETLPYPPVSANVGRPIAAELTMDILVKAVNQ